MRGVSGWVLVLACWIPLCRAQNESATLSGRVTDATGGAIAGAEVVLMNADTNLEQRTRTNEMGLYVFTGIHPGRFRVAAGAVGFKTLIKEDLTLHVQDEFAENFILSVGSVSEAVSVNADAIALNTTDASVSTVVDRQFVENMPLNGRTFQALIQLTPGVVAFPGAYNGGIGEFSVNGQRTETNYYTVDGVSANTGFYNLFQVGATPQQTQLGTTQSLVAVDALLEFRISTSTYSAEYGRSPGAQISLETRSGTNHWHGSIFDYFRNDALDANNWFNDHVNSPKTAERQNDFGGTLGGPVEMPGLYNGRDKTFLFFSYEGLRLENPQPAMTVKVPDLELRQTAPAAIQPLLDQFPLPNGPEAGGGTALFTGSYSTPSTLDSYGIRVDHTFSPKLTVFGRYADTPSETVSRGFAFVGLTREAGYVRSTTLGATSMLTNRIASDVRLNYTDNTSTTTEAQDNFGGATPLTFAKVMPGINRPPHSSFSAYFLFLDGAQPSLQDALTPSSQWNVTDTVSTTFGSHALKYGLDYRRQVATAADTEFSNDFYYFSEDQVLSNAALFALVSSNNGKDPKSFYTNFSAFIQDEWKATNRLHLSLGLRWDVNPPPTSNLPLYALTQATDLATMKVAPRGTPLYHTDYIGFAPRAGFAYQINPTTGRESVLRAGFGIFYDVGNNNALFGPGAGLGTDAGAEYFHAAFPLTPAQQQVSRLPFEPPFQGFDAPDPNLRLPYTMEWNVAFEQQLGRNQSLTLSYVAAGGRKLLQSSTGSVEGNPEFVPGPFSLSIVRNASTSGYNSFQSQFQRRLASGLEVLASYTWSHSIDDLSFNGDWATATGTYAALKRGNSDFDVRHNFSTALTYDVPGKYSNRFVGALLNDWGFDLRQTSRSALPFDIAYGAALYNTGQYATTRPDYVPTVPLYVSNPEVPGGREVNHEAFAAPASGVIGNAPRNFVRGLGAWQTDLAVRREFPVNDRVKLQFRAESFNLLNHPNFTDFDRFWADGPGVFGVARRTLNNSTPQGLNPLYQMGGPRSLQLALRVSF
jgi:hypothetical protein